jgi:hypothetical protein
VLAGLGDPQGTDPPLRPVRRRLQAVVCRATVSRLLGDGRPRTGTAASRWQTTPRRPSRSAAAPAAGHQPGQRRADVLGRAAAEAASQVNARPGRDPLSWVTAGCPGWLPLCWQAITRHRRRARGPAGLHGSWDAAVARRYGLMVIVTVPLTVLSCESCSCMGKLKVPALVGVPVRTLCSPGQWYRG